MHIAELWRYPVKSLAGEQIEQAELTDDGIPGDRAVYVTTPDGLRLVTSRTRPRLLGHRGTLAPDGSALIDGLPWDAPESIAAIEAAVGPGARLVSAPGAPEFDILPLLVATDGAIEAFGRDRRRLRPNILIGGVEGLAEREWEGAELHVGDAVIGLHSLRGRCVMTTFDPDSQDQDVEVLRDINRRFAGRLALNAWVKQPGTIKVGDAVEVVESARVPS
jgi:uncharacterized protein YcbX